MSYYLLERAAVVQTSLQNFTATCPVCPDPVKEMVLAGLIGFVGGMILAIIIMIARQDRGKNELQPE